MKNKRGNTARNPFCESCLFRDMVNNCCDYYILTGTRRPCVPTKCTVFFPRKFLDGSKYRRLIKRHANRQGASALYVRMSDGNVYDIEPMTRGRYPLKLTGEIFTEYRRRIDPALLQNAEQLFDLEQGK